LKKDCTTLEINLKKVVNDEKCSVYRCNQIYHYFNQAWIYRVENL